MGLCQCNHKSSMITLSRKLLIGFHCTTNKLALTTSITALKYIMNKHKKLSNMQCCGKFRLKLFKLLWDLKNCFWAEGFSKHFLTQKRFRTEKTVINIDLEFSMKLIPKFPRFQSLLKSFCNIFNNDSYIVSELWNIIME